MEVIEEKFHGPEYYFGDIIDVEMDKIIPALKKKYENEDKAMNLILYLNKKIETLMDFKNGIRIKAEKGEIDQEKYIQILKNFKSKNE